MTALKIIGIASTLGGLALSAVSDYVDKKEMEQYIDDCVDKKLNGEDNEES